MDKSVLSILMAVKQQVEEGVPYGESGAICPVCGERAYVCTTRKWEHGTRIRYHKCRNRNCVLWCLEVTIKSVEEFSAA
ncbi:MAG: ogr/Delta-like zinc finger family protein [Desulfovibrionales bacterium]|nr:ogr/Delta-like zinc finger family protein [Desulfovibrionales bacterium]